VRYAVWILTIFCARGQNFEQTGFLEVTARAFPQPRVGDASRGTAEALLRYNAVYFVRSWLRIDAGLDARTDSHRETERSPAISWRDRGTPRPALAFRNFNATFRKNRLTLQVGKQIIHWGSADTVQPINRFAPRDYLNPVESDVLPVTAARASVEFAGGTRRLELVVAPFMTPSRLPLARQRWMPLPPDLPGYPEIRQPSTVYPGRAQLGALWSHALSRFEYSACIFDGSNYNPALDVATISVRPLVLEATKKFAKMRMYGGDLVWTGKPFTVRAEGGYFQSTRQGLARGDDYTFYVLQIDKQRGSWSGGLAYAGQHITRNAREYLFDPDRALAGAFLGRVSRRIDSRSELRLESAAHRDGLAMLARLEYSRAVTVNWRATVGFTFIAGDSSHFVGQFRGNGYGRVSNRYSF